MEGNSWILLGNILGEITPPQMDRAEKYILKGIEIFRELKLRPAFSIGHLRLGELYLKMGKKDKAVNNIKKAEAAFQEMGMDYFTNRANGILAEILEE